VSFEAVKKKAKNTLSIAEAYKIGSKYKYKDEFDKRLASIKTDDVSTLIYTSGTTGNPKGVMLTNNNFLTNVINTTRDVRDIMGQDDIFLSFIPLSHSLEMTCGYFAPICIGAKVAFAEDVSTLLENFKEIRPTLLISVPRIYEKVHAGILAKVSEGSGVQQKIFNWAINIARNNLKYECKNIPRTGLFALQFKLADILVFSKLKKGIGLDRLRFAMSGGGPLAVSDAEFFIGMGIKVLEGFGLTETTPVTHYNRPTYIKPGTVGLPIPQTEVKIAKNGELLLKGPQIMKGYYKNPKATREVLSKDGWFKTGDLGAIDGEGFLSITGRIKDIIVTAGGKNISPQNIENCLRTSEFIEQVAVIGDRRKYLSALIIPDFVALGKWAKKNNIAFNSNKDLIENDTVDNFFRTEIDKYTKQFSRVEQIRTFTLLEAEWTQATGELTPTQKVKRRVIETKYAKEIKSLYPPTLD
jgi:long-chain acyl-CoA synthetase